MPRLVEALLCLRIGWLMVVKKSICPNSSINLTAKKELVAQSP
jgi:hypothetical protein